MKVTPRKAEVAAVVAVLEDTSFESGADMAKEIIKTVGLLFAERDWYAFAWRDKPVGGLSLAWGPLSSPTEVTRMAAKLAIGGEAQGVKLYSTAAMLATIEEQGKGSSKTCTTCGHPHGTHQHERQVGKCKVRGCRCVTDTK